MCVYVYIYEYNYVYDKGTFTEKFKFQNWNNIIYIKEFKEKFWAALGALKLFRRLH